MAGLPCKVVICGDVAKSELAAIERMLDVADRVAGDLPEFAQDVVVLQEKVAKALKRAKAALTQGLVDVVANAAPPLWSRRQRS